jgi:tetratricopeptide repeat protein
LTKDNLLFAVFGLVLGFVLAWLMYEKITSRQPQRLVAGQSPPAADGAGTGAKPGPGGGSSGIPLDLSKLEALQQQLDQNPDNPDIILALAHESYDIAQQVPNPAGSRPLWQQARDLYARYVELRPSDPNLPNILSDLGVTHQELGEYDEALEIFRQVRGIAPGHWQSLFNQVVVLAFGKKDFDEARKVLEVLKQEQPNNEDVKRLAAAVEAESKAAA